MRPKSSKSEKKTIQPTKRGIVFAKTLSMKKKILVADDDPGIRDIFKIIFEKAGYEVEIKDNPIDIYKNNFFLPDLFLIDKLLSGYDGLDVCRYLKDNPTTSHIPVIMISASPDIGILSAQAGADDFIEKPFDLNYILQVVERNISQNKSSRLKKALNK
jgi:DNA-binding response OmpR family regulator